MNGITLFCTVSGALICLAGLALYISWLGRVVQEDDEIDYHTQEAIEQMRVMLERETGREIAIAYRKGGYWHAVTALGHVPVSDLLKDGYIRVGGERK